MVLFVHGPQDAARELGSPQALRLRPAVADSKHGPPHKARKILFMIKFVSPNYVLRQKTEKARAMPEPFLSILPLFCGLPAPYFTLL